jgi:uncharacterized membrane protein
VPSDRPEPFTAAPQRLVFELDRLSALSDGVIAIAITLLVLELKIPEVASTQMDIVERLLAQTPNFVSWVISFVLISVVWHDQHFVFAHMLHCDTPAIVINLTQLAFVSLIPFGAHLVGTYENEIVPIIVFSVIMLLNGAAMAGNSWYVAGSTHLHKQQNASRLQRRALFHTVATPLTAAFASLMAILHHPLSGIAAWLITPLLVAIHHLYQAQHNCSGAKT